MSKVKIYLDNCCYNRPYDDQSYINVKIETEAKLFVQSAIKQGVYDLVWSSILDYENGANPFIERQISISKWRDIATEFVFCTDDVIAIAKEIMQKGIKNKDALHLACAIKANCDYFLTVDGKLLKTLVEGIKTTSPVDFVRLEEKL